MEGHMPNTGTLTFSFDRQPKEAVCDDGSYTVKLKNIGKPFEKTSTYNGNTKTQMKAAFTFEIIGGEYEGAELASFVAVDASPLNEKSTIHKVLKALYGGTIPNGGQINATDLIGRKCKVIVVNSVVGENVYSNITTYSPITTITPKKPAPKPAQPAPKGDAPLFDEEGNELADADTF